MPLCGGVCGFGVDGSIGALGREFSVRVVGGASMPPAPAHALPTNAVIATRTTAAQVRTRAAGDGTSGGVVVAALELALGLAE